MKISVKGKQITLNEANDYKGEGGFAKIYVKSGTAYKIYKKPKDMISAGKIRELSQIQLPNVYAPRDVIYDGGGKEIGFTMSALEKNEYLVKLFSRKFCKNNKVTPQTKAELVKQMQLTMAALHKSGFLVVDCNVMNFLVNERFDVPLFIDVDSYQTPSFPATALMETFRDRSAAKGHFTELSDFFSFALVAFNLYVGTHPYNGKHPKNVGENGINAMLDANLSVLHSGVTMPGGTEDLAVIPPAHLDWFKREFINGERSIPPLPDHIAPLPIPAARIIGGNEKFQVELVHRYPSVIQGIIISNASRYVLTDDGVYQEKTEKLKFQTRDKKRGIVRAAGDTFVIAEKDKYQNRVKFCNDKRQQIGEIESDDFSIGNECVYTITNGNLVENSFVNLGTQVIHQVVSVGQVFEATAKLFQNVVLQDALGKCFALIPFGKGSVFVLALPELDGHRFIDAKYERQFLIVFSEKEGKYHRTVFFFDKAMKYTVRMDYPTSVDSISFTVLQNGLCILCINDIQVEGFFDNNTVKKFDKPPFDSEDQLYSEGNIVMVIKDSNLYKVKTK